MSLRARLFWYPLAILAGFAAVGLALLGGLTATETGSRWLLRQLEQQVPGELAIERIEGTLLGGLTLAGIDYTLVRDRLQIGRLEVRWQPAGLLTATLQVQRLLVRDVSYQTPAGEAGAGFALPEQIALPLAITLGTGRIDGLQIAIGADRLLFDVIEVAARAGPLTGLRLLRLHIRAQDHVLDAHGAAALRQPYAFHAKVRWRSMLPDRVPLSGQGRLEGDLRLIALNHRFSAPVRVTTRGTLHLDGEIPRVDLRGSWQALQWPLTGTAAYSSREGDYELRGTPDAYRFTLSGDLTGDALPALAVRAQGHGDRRQLELEPLTLDALDGRLVASGMAVWSPQPLLELQVQVSDLNPGMQWPDWPGRLTGAARLGVRGHGEAVRFALEDIDLHGRLRDHPLQVRGGMALADERFSANDLRIHSGANRITLSGGLDDPSGLDVRIAAPELAAVWPGLGGRLEAEGRLQGTFAQPAGSGRLSAHGLTYREDYAADAVTAIFAIDAQRREDATAELHATGVRIARGPAADLSLQARGWLERHRLVIEAAAEPGGARLELSGAYRDARWEGTLALASFDLRALGEWRLREPVALRASATALQPANGCWTAGSAEACVHAGWDAAGGWQMEADLAAVPLEPLAALYSAPLAVQGRLEAELTAAGSAQGVQASLEARTGPGDITLSAPNQPPLQTRYREARLSANYAGETARLETAVRFEEGTLQGRFTLAGLGGTAPVIDGEAEVDLPDIRFIGPLVPEIEISRGAVHLQARLDGRLDAPRVTGNVVLEGGGAHLPGPGLALEDIRLQATGRDTRIALNGALRSGSGELTLTGNLDLDPGAAWPFDLALQGKGVSVVHLPDIEISASPDLALRGSLRQIDLSGRVDIPQARIRVRNLPPDVVQVSPDQVIVGERQSEYAARPPRIPVKINVLASLGRDVRFEGLGLTTRLRGDVNVRSRQGTTLVGDGVLVLEEGRYEGYGQRLSIERGRLLFAGPLDNPDLDIRATRTVGEVIAGIELSGTLEYPETRLFSDPAMPDAEILSYIVTGKPLSSASGGSDSQALAAAAASLGAGSPVAQEISATLGVDIGTQSGATDEETAVTVGKQITPRLYVDYLYGLFTEVATLQFVYTLSKHFSLLGESGAEQAIDLRFTIDRD
ncbi:MAG: translocation/assembly module TamB domain-containing protein [Gammaproteobacteria bacterium]